MKDQEQKQSEPKSIPQNQTLITNIANISGKKKENTHTVIFLNYLKNNNKFHYSIDTDL